MVKLISIGANFVNVLDEDFNVEILAKCGVDVVSKDSVVETVKESLIEFIEYGDLGVLYGLYEFGWYIASIVKV